MKDRHVKQLPVVGPRARPGIWVQCRVAVHVARKNALRTARRARRVYDGLQVPRMDRLIERAKQGDVAFKGRLVIDFQVAGTLAGIVLRRNHNLF